MSQKKRKKRYPGNLSDGAWRYLKPHLPVFVVSRPRELSMRQVLNAILYVLKTGCQWRQLPREFPVWSAVYYYFYNWSCNGTWERLHHLLRSRLREKAAATNSRRLAAWTAKASNARQFQGNAAMMQGKRSTGANAISWLTRWGYCWRSW